MGLYNDVAIAMPMPNSVRFRKLRIFPKVVLTPRTSAPRQSRKTLRE
jgi:hypothetical protein